MLGLTPGEDGSLRTLHMRENFGDRTLRVLEYSIKDPLFGLPDRHSLNSAFVALAMQTGVTTAITDPIKLGSAIKAIDLLLGRNANSMRYLKYFRATDKLKQQEAAVKV